MKPLSPRYTSMKFGWILGLATIAIGTYFLIAGAGVSGQVTPTYEGPDLNSYYCDGLYFRPPVYPFLLRSTNRLFGEDLHTWIVGIVQIILWGFASAAMWRISVPRYGRWGIALAIIYALLPSFIICSVARFVEAVAIPLMVFSALFLSEWLKHRKRSDLWLFASTLIIMLLTRPAFVYVFIATLLIAFPLLLNQTKRLQGKKMLFVSAIAFICTGMYSTYVYWQSGVFVPSLISVNNRYYMAREAGVLDPALNPSPKQKRMILDSIQDMQVGNSCKKGLSIWLEIGLYEQNEYGLINQTIPLWQIYKVKDQLLPYQSLNEMINRSIAAHRTDYYRYLLNNAYNALLTQPIISGGNDFPSLRYAPPIQHRFGELQVKMGLTLATATVFLLGVLIALLCKPKKLASRTFLFWMVLCCLGNLGTVILGAPYDYSRLFVVSVPLVFLIVAAVGHTLSRRIYKQYCNN